MLKVGRDGGDFPQKIIILVKEIIKKIQHTAMDRKRSRTAYLEKQKSKSANIDTKQEVNAEKKRKFIPTPRSAQTWDSDDVSSDPDSDDSVWGDERMYKEIALIYRRVLIDTVKSRGGDMPIDYSNEWLTHVVGRTWCYKNEGITLSIQRRDEVPFDKNMLEELKPYIDKVNMEFNEASDKFDKNFGPAKNRWSSDDVCSKIPYFKLNPQVILKSEKFDYKCGFPDYNRLLGTTDVIKNGENFKSKFLKNNKLVGAIGFSLDGVDFSCLDFDLEWESNEDLIVKSEKVNEGSETYRVTTFDCHEITGYFLSGKKDRPDTVTIRTLIEDDSEDGSNEDSEDEDDND